jgi:hypothetical protein
LGAGLDLDATSLMAATRIAPVLIPAAVPELVMLMTSAIVSHAAHRQVAQMGLTVLLLLLAAVVVYGRLALTPIAG